MKISILTLFPEMFSGPFDYSIVKRAQEKLDARGTTFTQQVAQEFSQLKHLILICGHYEGVDERVRTLVDTTISI